MDMSLVIEEAYLPATLTASPMTDEEFVQFCACYPDYSIEMSAEGEIIIMPPGDWLTSVRIGEILQELSNWSRANRRGWVTESSGGFVLPNGARRAPDVAWFPADKPGIPHGENARASRASLPISSSNSDPRTTVSPACVPRCANRWITAPASHG